MKTAHQIVLFILLTLASVDSSAQYLDWLISTTEGDAIFSDVVVDDINQRVYAVGTFDGDNVGAYQFVSATNPTTLGTSNSFTNGDKVAILVAFSFDGDLLWEAPTTDDTTCGFTSVDILANGNIVVGGYHQTVLEVQGTSGSATIPNLDGNGRLDAFFAVYDQDGAFLHAEAFGGDGDDSVTAIAVSSDGFLINTMSDGDAENFAVSNLEDDHIYRLCKYDLDYHVQWSFSAADRDDLDFDDYEFKFADLASNNDAFFFIGFNPNGNLQFDDALGNDTSINDLPGFGTQDIFVMSISNEGVVNWTQLVDQTTGNLSFGYGIDADCDQVFITGAVHYNSIQPVVFPGGISIGSSAHDNVFLAALNRETGLANWAKAFETSGGNHEDIGLGLVTDDKGAVFLTGTFSDDLYFDGYFLEHYFNRELFTLVYADNGNLLYGGSINSQGDDIGYAIDISREGELFIVGQTGQGGTIFGTELAATNNNALLLNYNVPVYASSTCCVEPSIANLPNDEFLAGDENCEALVPDYVSQMVLNAPCSNAMITQNPPPGTTINGTTIVSFNLSDDEGVNRTWTIEIGIEDITAPSASHNLPVVFDANDACEFIVPDLSGYLTINPDCSPVSVLQTPAVGDVLNTGTHTIEFLLSDDSGNTSTISHDLNVEDNIAPVIVSCPSDVTLSGTCSAILPDFTLSPELVVDENCSFDVGQWPGVGAEITEDDLIVLTVSDQSGNTSFCTFNASFIPSPTLDVSCGDFGASINLNSDCSFTMPGFTSLVTVDASCGQSYTIEQFPPSGTTITGAGDLELSFQVQDEYGYMETCSSTLEFNDVHPPNYTCPSSLTVFRNASCNFTYPNWVEVLNATDACGVSVVVNNVSVISDFLHQIQLGISDGTNNSTCVVNLNVLDTIHPFVEPIEPQLIPRQLNCIGLVPDLSQLVVATDNCTNPDELVISQLPLPGTEISESQVVSVFVSDQGGNTSMIEVALDLAENLAPSIVCSEDRIAAVNLQNCLFEIPDFTTELLVADECDYTINQSPSPGTLLGVGDHMISFVVSDLGGLSASCSFVLSVIDLDAPSVSLLPEPFVEIGEMCSYVFDDASILFQYEDCDPNPLVSSFSPPIGTELGIGVHEIEITIADSNGNTTVLSNFIHVEDNTAPSMLCPNEPISIAMSASCVPQFPDWISLLSADDDCSVSVSIEDITYVSDTNLLINIEITDGANNSSCNFNANLVDLTPPEIFTCVEDQSLEIGTLCEIELPDYRSLLLASDACSSFENLTIEQSPAPGTVLNENQTVSILITDEAGNGSSCEFNLVLVDNQAPGLSCPASLPDVHLDAACQYVMEDFTTAATVTDNCDLQSVAQSIAPGTILSEGLYQITFTAEDTFGNQSSCTSSFEVLDDAAPEITWIAELSFQSTNDCTYSVAEVEEYIDALDCNDIAFSMSPEAGTGLPAGIHFITIIAVDTFGNESQLETQIEVLPTNELAVESCASIPDQVMNDCSFIMPDFTSEISWSGICSEGISISQLPAAGTEFTEEQVIEVLFELNGTFGSFATCSSSFEITSALPSLSCEDLTIAALDCGAPLPDLDFFNFDLPDCADFSISLSPSSGTYLSIGTHLVSASISDNEGNTSSCSFNVTVEDQNAPQFDCQAFDLPSIETNCSYLIEDFTAGIPVDDNCSANLIITQSPINQLVGAGIHEITFIISDGSNEITCTKIIEVIDNQAPVFMEYNDINIELTNPDECGASVSYPLPTLDAPCGEEEIVLVEGLTSGSFFPIGEHLIVFEAIDENGNSNLISFTISVIDLAAPVLIEPIPAELCQGPVNYTLPEVMSDCGLVEVVQVNHPELSSGDVFPVGTTIIEFMATDEAGNSTSVFWEVNVLESAAAAWSELPASICSSEGVLNLNDYYLGDEEPSWNWGVEGVLNLGNYVGQILNITLSVGEGMCFADSTQSIHVIGPPNINAGESGDVCGLSTTLTGATNANTFWWEGDEGLSLFEEGLTCDVTASDIGVYELSFFATNGTCTSRDDIILNFVGDLGELSVVNNITTTEPVINISANYSGSGDVLWTTNSSSTISNASSLDIEISNMDEGLNLFFIEISNGICDPIQDTVYVDNILFDIPSGFSPNGDGANDTFEIIALSRYETKELQIFNRWGQTVYTNLNYDNSWDGTKDGVELIDDTYFYVLVLDNKEYTGYVVIRR